ncbi:amidohydrolase [Fictibacillus gelatini]|uniref:amidohydrolase n=1 Tax=Fictibacillus gelatini TaxID=225985 RepID=UPI00040DE32C|nr:amidohydrolase [Fictibacillus gelatini]
MGTLYKGGTIYTMKNEGDTVGAVYADHSGIIDIGSEKDLVSNYQDEIEEVVDLKEGVMFPGFVDSHLHLIGHGEKLIRLDLSKATSAAEMVEYLEETVSHTGLEEWVIGDGWNENNFPDRKIFHRLELDEIAPNRPMFLSRVCRHAFLANTKALELAGITAKTPDPPGGVIVRDEKGEATGLLLDSAAELVKKVIPPVSDSYLKRAITTSVDDLLSVGLVGGHTEDLNYYGGFERTVSAYKSCIGGRARKFKAHLLVHHEVADQYKGSNKGVCSHYLEFGAMKIFSDGAFGGRTALLSKPYNDLPETSGVAIHTPGQLKKLVQKAREHKMAVAVHTIGDLSLQYTIEAITSCPPTTDARDRIIHAGLVREDLIGQLKKLHIIIDIQPGFVASDFPWLIERLGEERVKWAYPFKTMLENGLHCAGGSDAPIEPVNPLFGIHAAITRRKPYESHEGYVKEQKLTPYEAIGLYTTGSAYAINKESKRGMIASGYEADFTVFDRDLLTISPDDLLEANVLYTIVDNTIVYKKTNV